MNHNKYKSCFENFNVTPEIINNISDTLNKKDLSWPYGITKTFEEKIKKFLKVKYALAHCNGTSAMYAAMFSVGVKTGSEVICPTYTFWASIAPAINLGARVVFCDVNSEDLLININNLEKCITPLTKAIIVPHLWGRLADIESIKKICKKYKQKIYIIEDASHSFGSSFKNIHLGTIGDVGIFSLQAGKPLIAGEGGLLVTNDYKLYESAIFFGHYERIRHLKTSKYLKYQKTGGGYKFRIHPLAATLALSQIDTINNRLDIQNILMTYFEHQLNKIDSIKVPMLNNNNFKYGGRFGFRILIPNLKNKNKFISECNKFGLKVEKEYIPLLHLEPFFSDHKTKNTGKGAFKNTETLYGQLISLPVFYTGNPSMIDSYVTKFKSILNKYL
jgi:dTDP-4-amino-4,6-dideoxygalactose transaminase